MDIHSFIHSVIAVALGARLPCCIHNKIRVGRVVHDGVLLPVPFVALWPVLASVVKVLCDCGCSQCAWPAQAPRLPRVAGSGLAKQPAQSRVVQPADMAACGCVASSAPADSAHSSKQVPMLFVGVLNCHIAALSFSKLKLFLPTYMRSTDLALILSL
jgi:hypothetical protein